MILRLFKANQPYVLLSLPLIAGIFWAYAFFTSPPLHAQYGGPLFEIFVSIISSVTWLAPLFSMLLVLAGAMIVNGLYNQHEFTERGNYLPALLFVLFNAFYIGFVGLTPIQFGNLFFLLALRRILLMYRQNSVASEVYDAGALLGIAILFYPPMLISVPIIWTSLIILRPFVWREWVLPLAGLATPFIFVLSYFFWYQKSFVWEIFFQPDSFSLPHDMAGHVILKWTFVIITLYFVLAGLLLFFSKMSASTINRKNKKQTFLLASFFLILTFLYASLLPGPSRSEISLLSIPLAVLTSIYFYSASRAILASILFYIWIITLLINFYWLWWF